MKLNYTEQKIWDYLKVNPKATIEDICNTLFYSRTTVTKSISQLKKLGLLEHSGNKKYGFYIVKNSKVN